MYELMCEYAQELKQEEHEETMKVQDSTLNIVRMEVQDNKD